MTSPRGPLAFPLAALLVALGLQATGCPVPIDPPIDEPDAIWIPPDGDVDGGYYADADADVDADVDADADADGDGDSVPRRSCTTLLSHDPPGRPASVAVAGQWNAWSPSPMADPDGDGVFEIELDLAPGEWAFKYVVDGEWEGQPPPDVYTHWSGGFENRNLRVGDCSVPLLRTVSASASSDGVVEAEVLFVSAADGEPVSPESVRVTVGDATTPAEVDVATGTIRVRRTGLTDGKHSVRVWAADGLGRRAEVEPLFVPLWVEPEPFEWRDATIYFTFTDRFRDGDWDQPPRFDPVPGVPELANYMGGDFLGIIHALEEGYFEQLGVNTLWLSPVYENPEGGFVGHDGAMYSGYHGYWPVLARAPERRFGDRWGEADDRLRELIDAAHARGIRVLFDLVLNHVHEDHEYTSSHPEWFGSGCVCGRDCDWDEHALDCWFTSYLPDLDYRNHAIVVQMVEDVLWWAREYDVDAFRIDAAKHMDHVIMRTLSMRVREELEAGGGAPFYLVGETYTFTDGHDLIMRYVADYELDGQFDFPLYYGIRDAFCGGMSLRSLEGMVATGEAAYGEALMSPFLGNHDVSRFATACAGNDLGPWGGTPDLLAGGGGTVTEQNLIDRASMAFAFLLTQPGAPLVYYGDEIGLAGSGDPDNRRLMTFAPYLSANQAELLERVGRIGRARAGSTALRRGSRRELWVDDDFYVYVRDAGGGDAALVALNRSGSPRSETVTVPAAHGLAGRTLEDVARPGRSVTVVGGSATVSLGAWDYAVLLRP